MDARRIERRRRRKAENARRNAELQRRGAELGLVCRECGRPASRAYVMRAIREDRPPDAACLCPAHRGRVNRLWDEVSLEEMACMKVHES